jgi:hypothetical protein
MNTKVKQLIYTKFETLIDSCLVNVDNKALVRENYEKMLKEILDARDKESVEALKNRYSALIQSKQFISINFEFKNIILGRPKPYYTSIPFEEELKDFYYPLSNFKELISGDNLYEIDIRNGAKFFQNNCLTFEDFLIKESPMNVNDYVSTVTKTKIVVQVEPIRLTQIENFFRLLFIGFICTNIRFPKAIKDFLMDLLSLENFLVNIKRINLNDMKNVNLLLKSVIECCDFSQNFKEDILDVLNHIISNEFVIQELSILLSCVFIAILQHTGINFYKKQLAANATSEDITSLKTNLNFSKNELLQVLVHQHLPEVNSKHLLTIYSMFTFIFNIQNLDILIFDGLMNAKSKASSIGENGTVIIFNESSGKQPFIIFDTEISELINKVYMKYSFQDFDEPNGDDSFTEGCLIRMLRSQKLERIFLQQYERGSSKNREGAPQTGANAPNEV